MEELSHESAVWQRVAGSRGPGFSRMAVLEGRIMSACRELYRRGRLRPQVKQIYQRAAGRKRIMEALARQSGEGYMDFPAEASGLLALLGTAAWGYDPTHPVYGPMLEGLRNECTHDQRLLLKHL